MFGVPESYWNTPTKTLFMKKPSSSSTSPPTSLEPEGKMPLRIILTWFHFSFWFSVECVRKREEMPLRIITKISSTLQTRIVLLLPMQHKCLVPFFAEFYISTFQQYLFAKYYISTFQQFKLLTFSFDVGYWSFGQGSFCPPGIIF